MLKRTPLFVAHQKLGGKLVEFGGWEMPVQYTSILEEHHAVRTAAGLFDISHMGEVFARGAAALPFLNRTLTNGLDRLAVGHGQYTLMCNEGGGVIDDLYVYRVAELEYLLIVNAARVEADHRWLLARLEPLASDARINLADESDQYGAVAVQGRRVVEFINDCFPGGSTGGAAVSKVTDLKKNQIGNFGDQHTFVSRTGYTGEDGFEIVAPSGQIESIWHNVLEVGRPFGLIPCGLGARDTLRTEMCYPLYGHELDENTTPFEAGLGFFVALDKGDFVGRPVLAGQKEKGVQKKCVAFKMADKSAPPRPHYPIWRPGPDATRIGEVVSGTQSPSLGVGIGLGYVPPEFAKPGTALEIEIRGKRSPAIAVARPIYRKPASG